MLVSFANYLNNHVRLVGGNCACATAATRICVIGDETIDMRPSCARRRAAALSTLMTNCSRGWIVLRIYCHLLVVASISSITVIEYKTKTIIITIILKQNNATIVNITYDWMSRLRYGTTLLRKAT